MIPHVEESFDFSVDCGPETDIPKTLAEIPARRGLILFADANNQPIQLLMCADLRRSARARLLTQSEAPTRRADIAAVCTRIYYSPIDTEFACQLAYNQCCRQLFPETCESLISLPKPCFVRIEKRRQLSYFTVSEKSDLNGECWGPFISRRNASEFADILNTAFELCRNPECLSSGRFESCPYYQMKTCTGPCLDTAQTESYQQNINDAASAASGETQGALDRKQDLMRQASVRLEFEKARRIRDQIDLLGKLKKPEFLHIHPMSRFCVLHLDTLKSSKKNPKWAAFILTALSFREIPFDLTTIEAVIEGLNSTAGLARTSDIDYLPTVCLFLYRSRRSGLWVDCSTALPTSQSILAMLQPPQPAQ